MFIIILVKKNDFKEMGVICKYMFCGVVLIFINFKVIIVYFMNFDILEVIYV